MTDEQLRQRWAADVEVIRRDVAMLVTDYYFYNDLLDLAMSGPIAHTKSYFWAWLPRAYSSSLLMHIRRLCEPDNTKGRSKRERTRSLALLLEDIRDHCEALTLEWFAKLCSPAGADLARQDFEHWCGPGAKCLPRGVVEADLAELAAKVTLISDHVDQCIAHSDRDPTASDQVKKMHVEEALACVGKMVNRYSCLLTGISYDVKGTIAQNWHGIFTKPWVVDRQLE